MKKILLVWCLFIWAASVSARPFVLGMYGVDKPEYLPLLKEAGFNCFQTYKVDPALLSQLAQAAAQNNMQALFYPNKVIGSPQEQAAKNWPMVAWYLVDEPDVARWSRERVIQAREAARAAFAQTATALVIGQGKTRVPFYELSDILMMDWYPVPHLALTWPTIRYGVWSSCLIGKNINSTARIMTALAVSPRRKKSVLCLMMPLSTEPTAFFTSSLPKKANRSHRRNRSIGHVWKRYLKNWPPCAPCWKTENSRKRPWQLPNR